MRYIKHYSDEWMRRAAEDFPVQPMGMNWELIAEQLKDEEDVKKLPAYPIMRYASLILFFMLLSLLCNKYIRFDFEKRYAGISHAETTVKATVNNKNVYNGSMRNAHSLNEVLRQTYSDITDNKEASLLTRSDKKRNLVLLSTSGNEMPTSIVYNTLTGDAFSIHQQQITPDKVILNNPTVMLTTNAKVESHSPQKEAQVSQKLLTKQRLYAGLLLGPDVSNVKNQKFTDVGYNLGIIIGYKFNQKWQIESGVFVNRKTYYSDGYYFNAGKVYLPQHSEILDVEGYCDMLEIPINVRYNLTKSKTSQWFATAGSSSYVMKKEDYDYRYKRYGNEYSANKYYKNATKDWFSVLNVSLGYEHKVGSRLLVRLEPYYKIPLRGMGTGKLAISSTGMNIGVSYPIH